MPQSPRYRQFEKRIRGLEAVLPTLKPTGDYEEEEFDYVRAYRLLAHAEIEACIEDLARIVANKAVKKWEMDGRPRRTIIALLAFVDTKAGKLPGSLPADRRTLRNRVGEAKNAYVGALHRSHGIREKDVLAILLPVGFREVDFDPTWLAIIDSFGEERGETAHTTARVQRPPDPKSEKDRVWEIAAGIRDIDSKLISLKR